MFISPVVSQNFTRAFPIDTKRSERSRSDLSTNEREKEKTKPEEEEKRPRDLAVA